MDVSFLEQNLQSILEVSRLSMLKQCSLFNKIKTVLSCVKIGGSLLSQQQVVRQCT